MLNFDQFQIGNLSLYSNAEKCIDVSEPFTLHGTVLLAGPNQGCWSPSMRPKIEEHAITANAAIIKIRKASPNST